MLITNAADQDANQHKTIMVGGIRKHTLYISNYVQLRSHGQCKPRPLQNMPIRIQDGTEMDVGL